MNGNVWSPNPAAHIDQLLQNQKPSLLIVEDEPTLLDLLSCLLTEQGFLVLKATTAEQALQILEATQQVPILFILNHALAPNGMTGLELYDYLHAQPGYEHIPALIMSAALPCDPLSRMIRSRFIIGLSKPYHLNDFFQCVRNLLPSLPFHEN